MANVRQAHHALARRWHDFDVLATATFGRPPTKDSRIPKTGDTTDRANFVIAMGYLRALDKCEGLSSAAKVFEMLEEELVSVLSGVVPDQVARILATDERQALERIASDIDGR